MKMLIEFRGLLPMADVKDVTDLLRKATPQGSFLIPSELLDLLGLVISSRLVKSAVDDAAQSAPSITALARRLKDVASLEAAITAAVGPDGEIRDTASPALKRIRAEIIQTKNRARSLLEDLLNHQTSASVQEKYITIRNDRYVIPVRAEIRRQVPGVVHDQSRNQATYFIEPFSVVELNNTLILLKEDEKEEEILILKNLTDRVREKKDHLINNQRCLAILDTVQAKARLSIAMQGLSPELTEGGDIALLEARHPLLLHQQVTPGSPAALPAFDDRGIVPIDLAFPPHYSVSIITGANMGGKTAALKTLGLLTLMVHAGLHIPVAQGSRLSLWKAVFADIGDEQSLEQHVSTFSSHLSQLNVILTHARKGSLVLLDEIGTGTDPQEGGALALAIIDELRRRKVKIVATSHLNLLKSYAITHPDVMNISVACDQDTLQPTYRLVYGVPGTSKAFETAARLGIGNHILRQAASYLSDTERQGIELIEEMRTKVGTVMHIQRALEELLRSAVRYEAAIAHLAQLLQDRRAALFVQTEKSAKAFFREVERELREARKKVTRTNQTELERVKHHLAEIKDDLQSKLPSREDSHQALGELKEGDRLTFGKGGEPGQVVDVNRQSNKVEVHIGGVRIKAHVDDLSKIKGAAKDTGHPAPPFRVVVPSSKPTVPPLTIVGMTVAEALPVVDKALNDSLLSGQKEMRIIHGIGTGRLQQAVHDYLRDQPDVHAFYLAARQEGGAGVTVVELES